MAAGLADCAHPLSAQPADAAPQDVFFTRAHPCELLGNVFFRQAFVPQQHRKIEFARRHELRAAGSAVLSWTARRAPVAREDRLGLLSAVQAKIAALVILGLLRAAMDAVDNIGGIENHA